MSFRESRTRQWKKYAWRVLFALGCSGCVVSWLVGNALVAPALTPVGQPPDELDAIRFRVDSQSGSQIQGWCTQPDHVDGVVVLVHGIRSSRKSMLGRAIALNQRGYATVMIDLQGHGESPGEAITVGHLEKHDVAAAVEYAHRRFPKQPIGLIGVSLGGASALLATPLNLDAMVLESVFPTVTAAVHNRVEAILGVFAWVPSKILLLQLRWRLGIPPTSLRPIDMIHQIECPLLIASGALDLHTTAAETRELYRRAPKPKELWIVDGAGHVDLRRIDPIEYDRRIGDFFDQHLRHEIHSSERSSN